MSLQFQSLFTIQVLHDYYTKHDSRCADFDIVPAEDCALHMKNMRMLHKNYNNKLLTVINAAKEPNSTPPPASVLLPFIDFNKEVLLRFYLVLKNPYFSNFTALALKQSEKKRLFFSNLSKNKVGSSLSLSAAVSTHNFIKTYAPGNVVKGPDNNFYEALRSSDGTAESKDLANTSYWQKVTTNNPYVNDADEVTVCGNSFTYPLQTPASNIIIKIFALDKNDANLPFTRLLSTIEKTFIQNQQTVSIDVSKYPAGKYKLVINGESDTWIYIDANAVKQNVFGIVEIHHFEKLPADFQLLTPANHIKNPEPVFTIWFKNRSVTWKYISQNGNISVTDSDATPKIFEPPSALAVTSKAAIGLTETPVASLTATKTSGGKQIKNLKNPDIEKLVFEASGDTGFYISNMYVKIDT
jgi:hypothetical protein